MAFNYFGNKILMSQGDDVGLKAHHMYDISNDDFHYLKPGLMSRRQLNALHHYTSGRGVFVPTQMAAFMEEQFPRQTKFFRQMLLVATNRLEFAQDLNAEIGTKENGVEGYAMDYVQRVSGIARECTIVFPAELDGGFFTFYMNCWIHGIMSPRDGVQHMYGYKGAPTPANYSMEGIYFTMDPSEQFAIYTAYVQNMIPKIAQNSIFNTTKGEFQHQEISLQFACITIDNDQNVFEAAQAYLDSLNDARGHETRLTGVDYENLEIPQSGTSVI